MPCHKLTPRLYRVQDEEAQLGKINAIMVAGFVGGGLGAVVAGGDFWSGAAIGAVVAGLNEAMHDPVHGLSEDDPVKFDKVTVKAPKIKIMKIIGVQLLSSVIKSAGSIITKQNMMTVSKYLQNGGDSVALVGYGATITGVGVEVGIPLAGAGNTASLIGSGLEAGVSAYDWSSGGSVAGEQVHDSYFKFMNKYVAPVINNFSKGITTPSY